MSRAPGIHPDHLFDTGYHAPALVQPVVELLGGRDLVLDGTLGGGGHSAALLEAGVGRVIGIDRDPDALRASGERLAEARAAGRFETHQGNYADLDAISALRGVQPDGILLDLGISSHQIDDASRGFSFREGAPLDMRMGADATRDAAAVLNESGEMELASIFREYGDETKATRLAREIVRRRATQPFATSDHFVNAIRAVHGASSGPTDFARLFQAVRIAVNDEIAGIERALPALRDRLAPGGILAIMAYHSGEDRLVKHAFRRWSEACHCPPKHPVCTCGGDNALGTVLTRRAIVASPQEDRPQSSRSKREAARMAKGRVGGGRGRLRLAFILTTFLVIAGVIVLRRTVGISGAHELLQLDARRAALVAERLRLEAEVRAAGSRARLQPIAEQRLQMHVPADSQVIILQRSTHESP